uniref:Secreted protein n=1 Tax=Timema bartmani TaxID=61472 RepID=A0A7R9EM01_9NEOP|nr:unnamed protein product [Timema bartmani]
MAARIPRISLTRILSVVPLLMHALAQDISTLIKLRHGHLNAGVFVFDGKRRVQNPSVHLLRMLVIKVRITETQTGFARLACFALAQEAKIRF